MKNGNAKPRNGLIAALDIGTTKICCLIARNGEFDLGPQIVGSGHHVSAGMRNGVIVDMEALEAVIRSTVEAAEQMAGENIRDVVVNLSSVSVRSRLVACEVSTAGHRIDYADLRRLLNPDVLPPEEEGRDRLAVIPVGYSIDGTRGVRDPIGMYGDRLAVNLHVISAASPVIRNIETVVECCHLAVSQVVVGAQASAQSCLVGDETKLGVTMIDIGGGATSVAVFFDGELVHTSVVPVGGSSITNDIARGLSTSLIQAERIKTLFGNTMPSSNDDRAVIEVPLIGGEGVGEASQVPRSMLVGIIRPRVQEIMELVRDQLAKAGFNQASGPRVVLTGGSAQLTGIADIASDILDRHVRIGRPRALNGLAQSLSGPAFSTAVGLINCATSRPPDISAEIAGKPQAYSGSLSRIGQWLKENF